MNPVSFRDSFTCFLERLGRPPWCESLVAFTEDQAGAGTATAAAADTHPQTVTGIEMTPENTLEYPEAAPSLTVAEVAAMIQRGEPLPGVKQIPSTLSDQPPAPPAMKPRAKPWETNSASSATAESSPSGLPQSAPTSSPAPVGSSSSQEEASA